MPEPIAPPAIPNTAVHPTPAGEYKLSEHAPAVAAPRNPDLTSALQKRAGNAPERHILGEPKIIPSQPPKAPLPAQDPKQSAEPDVKPASKFVPADDLEPAAAAVKVDPEAKPAAEPSPEELKSVPAKLREAYEKLKTDFATRAAEGDFTKKQLAEFQSKAKTYEDRIKTLEGADARAKELEKAVVARDEQLRITNYTQTEEFHTQYVKPVADATQAAFGLVEELTVTLPDGSERLGTKADFYEVLGQPNKSLAKAKARTLFGEDFATEVFQAAEAVKGAQGRQSKAMQEAGVRSQEWLKHEQERIAQARTTARTDFERVATSLAEKYPQLYRPPEGDKDALAARQSGEQLARLILDGQPEGMPSNQWLETVAKVYHRAASFPMRELAISRLQTELDATKAKLAAYEKSTPDGDSRKSAAGVQVDAGGAVVGGQTDYQAMLHASLAKRAGRRT